MRWIFVNRGFLIVSWQLSFLYRTIAQVGNPFITACIVQHYLRKAVGKFFHYCPMVQTGKCLIWCGKILKTSPGSSFWKLEGKAERADCLHAHFFSFLFKFCAVFLRYCLGHHVMQDHKQITRLPQTIKMSAVVGTGGWQCLVWWEQPPAHGCLRAAQPVSSQEKKGEGDIQRGTTRWL